MSSQNLHTYILSTDIVLTDRKGKNYILASKNGNKDVEVMYLKIFESIESPCMMAEMNITDSGVNLIGTIPIQGMEKITFGLKTPYFSTKEYKYTFYISAVRSRFAKGKIQNYVLDLISYEGLKNESIRIGKTLTGTGDAIAKNVLNDYLKADRTKISEQFFEPCKYQTKIIPSNKRPFDIIGDMLNKCVSGYASSQTFGTKSSLASGPSISSTSSGTSTTPEKSTVENLTGSAGYCFWETQEGYKFKSLDNLCSIGGQFNGDDIKDTFVYSIANTDYNKDAGRNILEYNYVNEIDVVKKMRYGTYSSLMVFYNPSTGQYEEYVFDIEKAFKGMGHMGKEEDIPELHKELAKYPTRIMTQFIDDEVFYNGKDIASIDPKNRQGVSGSSGSPFPDYKKYYMAQSISRSLLMGTQKLHIVVGGNLSLRAGDKIKIMLPNFSVESKKTSKKYDEQHSGNYLIKDISYEFHLRLSGKNYVAVSNVTLIRDTFGMKSTS